MTKMLSRECLDCMMDGTASNWTALSWTGRTGLNGQNGQNRQEYLDRLTDKQKILQSTYTAYICNFQASAYFMKAFTALISYFTAQNIIKRTERKCNIHRL